MLSQDTEKFKPYDLASSCTFYLGAIIVVLVCQAAAAVVSSALVGLIPDISKSGDYNTACMMLFQIANAAFIIVYSRLTKHRFAFSYIKDGSGRGITPAAIIVPVIGAGVLMAAMYLPTVWYGYLTEAIGIPPDAGNIELSTPSSVVMIVIAAVFFAPLCEETIYRGVLFTGLKTENGVLKAVMLSALSFMLMHMSPIQVVFQFSLGVLSGYLFYKSERLLPSIILHAAANALALVMQMTPLGAALGGAVEWLTQNIAAAVFITLGLFIAGGAILFFGIDLSFGGKTVKRMRARKNSASSEEQSEEIKGETADAPKNVSQEDAMRAAVADARRRDARFKYIIAAGICGVMFILNLVLSVIPQ